MKYGEMIEALRDEFVCRGTGDIVVMSTDNYYYKEEFIQSVIDEIEKLPVRFDKHLNPLERLGLEYFFAVAKSRGLNIRDLDK